MRIGQLLVALMLAPSIFSAAAAGDLKSGLPVGEVPPSFDVYDVTGPHQGKYLCYRCSYGSRPVVGIFARKVDKKLAGLIERIDRQVGQHEEEQLRAFVIVLTEDPDEVEPQLLKLAEKHKLKHTPLTLFEGVIGPEGYEISEKAETTVLMWNRNQVRAVHALGAGRLDTKRVASIVLDATKLLKQTGEQP